MNAVSYEKQARAAEQKALATYGQMRCPAPCGTILDGPSPQSGAVKMLDGSYLCEWCASQLPIPGFFMRSV